MKKQLNRKNSYPHNVNVDDQDYVLSNTYSMRTTT